MHVLFTAFDREVKRRGLFKMDTVGDAYICAGFIQGPTRSADSVCRDVLAAAGAMLRAVDAYRVAATAAGQSTLVRCRIGVAVGPVVAGALGRLQPRFHLFGPGLREAEMCEQTGREGALHASQAFISALRGAGIPSDDWKASAVPSQRDRTTSMVEVKTRSSFPQTSFRSFGLWNGSSRRVMWESEEADKLDVRLDVDERSSRADSVVLDPLAGWEVIEEAGADRCSSAAAARILLRPGPGGRYSVDFSPVLPYKIFATSDGHAASPSQKGSPLRRAAAGAARYCAAAGLMTLWSTRQQNGAAAELAWVDDPMGDHVFATLNSASLEQPTANGKEDAASVHRGKGETLLLAVPGEVQRDSEIANLPWTLDDDTRIDTRRCVSKDEGKC